MFSSKSSNGVAACAVFSARSRACRLISAAAIALFAAGHSITGALADDELRSTPSEAPAPAEPAFETFEALEEPLPAELAALIAGGKVTVGLEFELDRLGFGFGDNGFIPPDTMGAVGPNHIVHMINGRFQIYDKVTGAQLDNRSLDSFWNNVVGLTTANSFRFDPRVVYDPDTRRWFAVSIDRGINIGITNPVSNNFFIARTDTDDPTGVWQGFTFVADTVEDPQFHDYPTLAVDRVGLYTCTQDFGPGSGFESCYSLPKADVIASPPDSSNLARFEEAPPGLPPVSGSWQPALDFGPDDGSAALLGVEGGNLVRTDIFNAGTATLATLGTSTAIAGDPGHSAPPAARQPHPTDPTVTLENVAPRFVSNVVEVDDSIWAVHAVLGSASNSALRWYEIDEVNDAVLQTGLIDDPDRDFHEPSIAANANGQVVIGYTCSGPTLPASTCVSIGETEAGVTTFEPPTIIFTGLGHYYRDFCNEPDNTCGERNRWGDYSATVVDPVDSCTFWTFQEYVAQSATGNVGPTGPDGTIPRDTPSEGGLWGTRVAELTFNSCAGGDLRVLKDCKPDENPLLIGETGTCTITVDNLGPGTATDVRLVDRYISNAEFFFGTITPSGLCTFTSNPQNEAGDVQCELGNMAPDERIVVEIDVTADTAQDVNDTATVSSASTDPNLDNNVAQDTLRFVNASADLALQKDCTPNSLAAGGSSVCSMIVSNLGPDTAENVELVDIMSASAPFDYSVDDGVGTCDSGSGFGVTNPTLTCDLASLASGGQWTVQVTLTSATANVIDDNASVTSDAADPDSANDQASDSVVFSGSADLSVEKEASPTPDVVAGTNVTYTLTVENAGPSPAVNVVVTDTLPAGMTPISVSSSTGSCTNGAVASCNLNTIASGGSETMTVVAKVNADVAEGTTLSNTAEVDSGSDDPNTENNVDHTSLNVVTIADLSLEKFDSPDPALAGGTLTYMFAIHNAGPSNAVGAIMDDLLPSAVTFQSFNMTGAAGSCFIEDAAANRLRCLIGDMAPDANVSVSVDVLVDPSVPNETTIANEATVYSSTTDNGPGLNDASQETTINTAADLWIDKTGNFVTGNPSTTIIYYLTVYNRPGESQDDPQVSGEGGPSDAQNVVVTDMLPTTGKKNEPVSIVFLSEDCTAVDLLVTCQTDTIKVGEAAQHQIHIQVSGKVEELLNVVEVTSDTADPDSGNNSDSLLMVVKGGSDRPGGPGGGRGNGGGGGKNK